MYEKQHRDSTERAYRVRRRHPAVRVQPEYLVRQQPVRLTIDDQRRERDPLRIARRVRRRRDDTRAVAHEIRRPRVRHARQARRTEVPHWVECARCWRERIGDPVVLPERERVQQDAGCADEVPAGRVRGRGGPELGDEGREGGPCGLRDAGDVEELHDRTERAEDGCQTAQECIPQLDLQVRPIIQASVILDADG